MRTPLNRLAWLPLVFLCVTTITASRSMVAPEEAKAASNVPPESCASIPDPMMRKFCEAPPAQFIPGIPNPVDLVTGAVSAAAGAIVEPIFNQIVQAEAKAVLSVLNEEVEFVNSNSTPVLTSIWFTGLYKIVFGLAVFLAIGLFWVRFTEGAKNQDVEDMGNTGLAILLFFLLGATMPGIVGGLVEGFDNKIAPAWMNVAGENATATLKGLETDFNEELSASNNPIVPIVLPLIYLFFGVIGGIVLQIMLLFREGMLYVVTAAEVIAIAGWVGGRWGINMLERTSMALIALILFKCIVSFILVVGLALMNAKEGASPILLGTVTLLSVPILSLMAYKRISGHDIEVSRGVKSSLGYLNMLRRS
ncbi:hypothetical protein H0X09_00390 [Candidatus Saccharibacteria bacterium]|nr:hypothetical protein [Candidatus Saccharibacteria bacterium]